MPDYSTSKIYKIWSAQTNAIYIGATTKNLCDRMAGHKYAFKKGSGITAKQILKYPDAKIELIIECPCSNKEQLNATEGLYIRSLSCVNKNIPNRTDKEYREDNQEKIKEYRENNKIEINEKKRKKINCDVCNTQISLNNMSAHQKSKKCMNYPINLNNIHPINTVSTGNTTNAVAPAI